MSNRPLELKWTSAQDCPHLGSSCPFISACKLYEGTGRTYCRAWVEEQQAAGRARLVKEKGQEE